MNNQELSKAYNKLGEAYIVFDGKSSPEINQIKNLILTAQSMINTKNMNREYAKINNKG